MLTLSAIGNLGRDPELSYYPAGKAVCRFSVACSRRWRDQTIGERKAETIWLTCTAFDRLAETIGEHLQKGAKVYLEGSPSARAWTGKQGHAQASLDVIVSTLEMLDPKAAATGARADTRADTTVDTTADTQEEERRRAREQIVVT
jgi:single-strand DNA-binding protein